jgi:hypothetical protein
MKEKKSVNEKLSDALDVSYEKEQAKETNIVKKETNLPVSKEKLDKDLEIDYNQVRGNIKNLISTGKDAIDGIIDVATESDAPRAYEVASQMLKTVSEMNKDLMNLHQQMKTIRKEEMEITNNTTNNSIYVGSTNDLQDLINQSRSKHKHSSLPIIDVDSDEVKDE